MHKSSPPWSLRLRSSLKGFQKPRSRFDHRTMAAVFYVPAARGRAGRRFPDPVARVDVMKSVSVCVCKSPCICAFYRGKKAAKIIRNRKIQRKFFRENACSRDRSRQVRVLLGHNDFQGGKAWKGRRGNLSTGFDLPRLVECEAIPNTYRVVGDDENQNEVQKRCFRGSCIRL